MSRERAHLHPLVVPVVALLEQKAEGIGLRVRLIETYRDNLKQMEAWQKGRNNAGEVIDRSKVVTWKRPGDSWHNLKRFDEEQGMWVPSSFAFHLALEDGHGHLLGFGTLAPATKAMRFMYVALAVLGEELGLRSGTNWNQNETFLEAGEDDLTHFEFHPDGATLSQVKAVLEARLHIG